MPSTSVSEHGEAQAYGWSCLSSTAKQFGKSGCIVGAQARSHAGKIQKQRQEAKTGSKYTGQQNTTRNITQNSINMNM